MAETDIVILCPCCKKPLIHRLQNGLWHLAFGKRNKMGAPPVIDLYVFGNIKMRCWHGDCQKWITLNYLPKKNEIILEA